jgi:hypothetical protein
MTDLSPVYTKCRTPSLQDEGVLTGPLFIFIDELDRCRPDYSIRLLEGIKHMFAVPGVAFVVSTNLDQLSKSVQGVYGPSFNGYSYLKRFFDFEFTLPDPDNYSFAQLLGSEQPIFKKCDVVSGLLPNRYPEDDLVARAFTTISTALRIPLRDQRQIWTIAGAACTGIPDGCKVHVLWLFFLSALRHLNPEAFDTMYSQATGEPQFLEFCNQLGINKSHTVKSWEYHHNDLGGFRARRTTDIDAPLSSILSAYRTASRSTAEELNKRARADNAEDYPNSLVMELLYEKRSPAKPQLFPSIAQYPKLVKMAGLIS